LKLQLIALVAGLMLGGCRVKDVEVVDTDSGEDDSQFDGHWEWDDELGTFEISVEGTELVLFYVGFTETGADIDDPCRRAPGHADIRCNPHLAIGLAQI
jgi:hypothetical protein